MFTTLIERIIVRYTPLRSNIDKQGKKSLILQLYLKVSAHIARSKRIRNVGAVIFTNV